MFYLRPVLTTSENENEIRFVFGTVEITGKSIFLANEFRLRIRWPPIFHESEMQIRGILDFHESELRFVALFVNRFARRALRNHQNCKFST